MTTTNRHRSDGMATDLNNKNRPPASDVFYQPLAIRTVQSLASSMQKCRLRGVAGAIALASVTVTWQPFHSTVFPYSINQPSSFKHAVLSVSADQRVDYFSPPIGSATTNVTISAATGGTLQNAVSYLESIDGHHIKRTGTMNLAGRKRAVMCADFSGLSGKWKIEQVSFVAKGFVWRLTASYAPRSKSLRNVMMKMLQSFRLNGGPPR